MNPTRKYVLKSSVAKSIRLVLLALLFPVFALAQTTRSDETKPVARDTKKGRILVVPWDPKMFNCNSDVSRAISKETGQKYEQIQESMRKGFVQEVKYAFGAEYHVISLLDDTAKTKTDLHNAYVFTSLSYTPVNAPLNLSHEDSVKLKQKKPAIKNGQVQTEEEETDKFMNTVVLSTDFIGYLKKKYKADYILFVNEMDIDNDLGADPYNYTSKQEFQRYAIVHFTIINTTTCKRVAMGKIKSNFPSSVNTPKKIIETSCKPLAKMIYDKFALAIKPKE
ncbi:MAG TPA: hypothetical protein VI731_03110 [Bacteroidia bacterium]|nr:hypothetical protein [Bacteroidia bacterium]